MGSCVRAVASAAYVGVLGGASAECVPSSFDNVTATKTQDVGTLLGCVLGHLGVQQCAEIRAAAAGGSAASPPLAAAAAPAPRQQIASAEFVKIVASVLVVGVGSGGKTVAGFAVVCVGVVRVGKRILLKENVE